jgi:hypothetical protein
LVLPLFFACSTGEDTAPVDDSCGVEIDETRPATGQTDWYYRSALEFELSDPDDSAVLSVEGVSGTSVVSDDGELVTFTPDSSLEPSTSYTATLDYCTGSASVDFTTSELGQDVDTNSLVGKSYALDLGSGRIVVPAGVGSLLEGYLDYTIFLGVDSAAGSEILLVGAVADEENPTEQDFCTVTLDFPAADFSESPYFKIGPSTTTLDVAGYSIEIADLFVAGTFSSDGSWMGGGSLSGSIDTRPLTQLLGDDEEEGAICDLVGGFGVDCENCSDGEPYCLAIEIVDMTAEDAGLTVEVVDQEDCHEECPESKKNPECIL